MLLREVLRQLFLLVFGDGFALKPVKRVEVKVAVAPVKGGRG